MSRRHSSYKREILPDTKYKDVVVTKFINCIMVSGKKTTAERIVYGAIEALGAVVKLPGIEAFRQVLANVKPAMEVRSRRIGGATYQVPVEVSSKRAQALSIRWLIVSASKRSEKNTMEEKLAAEFIDAFHNKGGALKIKEEKHKAAEANRAFAHYKIN
jgi:small subunit ribosomal protein S7